MAFKIHATPNTDVAPPANAPECPEHYIKMRFLPAKMKFVCPTEGCRKATYGKGMDENGPPRLVKTDLSVLIIEDSGTVLMRLDDYNIMLDVTNIIAEDLQIVPTPPTDLDTKHGLQPFRFVLGLGKAFILKRGDTTITPFATYFKQKRNAEASFQKDPQ